MQRVFAGYLGVAPMHDGLTLKYSAFKDVRHEALNVSNTATNFEVTISPGNKCTLFTRGRHRLSMRSVAPIPLTALVQGRSSCGKYNSLTMFYVSSHIWTSPIAAAIAAKIPSVPFSRI